MNSEKNLLVISGPSGCGKDTIVRRLLQTCPWMGLSVSATTRPARPGEVDGVDYYFLSREDFEKLIAANELLEYTQYVGNYYGTLKSEVDARIQAGKAVVLVIEVEGAHNVKRLYPGATAIFVTTPSMEELERRLRGRGTESDEKVAARLARAREEMAYASDYDYRLVNGDLEQSVAEVERIFTQNRGLAQT